MKKRNSMGPLAAGLIAGMLMGAPTAQAMQANLKAVPSGNTIYVDGQQVELEAYRINGANYVKLRDVGQALDVNVYWLDGVRIDTTSPYTGEAPAAQTGPTVEELQAADKTATDITQDADAIAEEIIVLTNDLRRQHGLAELNTSAMLTKAARVRADEMAASGIYTHTRPDGSAFYTVTDCPYMAENIHRVADWTLEEAGMDAAELAVKDWNSSPGHQRNLLNERVTGIGVGLARGTNRDGLDCWYIVQLFQYPGYPITWVDQPIPQDS